jgi:hypothetical protein
MHGKSGIQWAVNNMQTLDRIGSRMNCLLAAALMWFAWMAAMPEAWAQSLQCGDRVGVTYLGHGVNIRDGRPTQQNPCGASLGTLRAGDEGQIVSSSCSWYCNTYTYWNGNWVGGRSGWVAQGTSTQRWLVPMPGSGYYPNVSAPGAYPVRVYDDIGSGGLRVRLGPGLNYPEMDVPRRYPGETGTAYVVRVRQDEGLVWWRIRWSNGDIGWSADSQVPYGVYLVKTGGYSSFTIVQLRLEASGAGGSVGILVGTPDLDAAIPPNFTVSTPATLRYVSGDRVRLTAPQTAPNGAPFRQWLRNGSPYSSQRYIEFTITSNDTFTAVYAYPTNTISIQSSNPNSGVYITVSPNDNNGAGSGYTPFTRTYNQGTTVTLTAPDTAGGNQFQEWQRNGVRVSTRTTYQFQVNANDTLTAVYRTPTNTISIQSSNPNSGVYITVSPNDNNGAGSGYTPFTRTYNQGTTVTLTAPDTAGGNQFQEWQRNGVRVSTRTTYQFQVNANDTITAVYRQHSIGIEVQPAAINFGDVWTIAAGRQQLRITNPSSSTGNLTGTLRTLSPPFAIEGERTFSLAPGQSHTVVIRYAPGEPRTHSAILYIDHNATTSSSPISVPIQGRGCDSDLLVTNTLGQSISGTTLRLTAEVGRTTNYLIRVTHRVFNNSQCPIIVTPVLSGSGSSAFSVSPSQTFVLEPNAERQVTLTFAPQRAGTHNAILEFRYTVSGMPANVYLFKRITLEGTARGRDNPGQTSCNNNNITASIDRMLLDAIDQAAGRWYRPEWGQNGGVTLDQFKAWLAVIAWSEVELGGYGAHSACGCSSSPRCRRCDNDHISDCIRHPSYSSFSFSTGIGYFQLDRGGPSTTPSGGWSWSPIPSQTISLHRLWGNWPTLAKADPYISAQIVAYYHYETFTRRRYTLYDFWNVMRSVWFALAGTSINNFWRQVTGTEWSTNPPAVNWNEIRACLEFRATDKTWLRFENNVCYKGQMRWNLITDTVVLTGCRHTWLITARGNSGYIRHRYYYTFDDDSKVEAWVLADSNDNPTRYYFTRRYERCDRDECFPPDGGCSAGGTANADIVTANCGSVDSCPRVNGITFPMGDVNGDGCVDDQDLTAVLFAFGQVGEDLPEDVNLDGVVDDADILLVLENFGFGCE